MKKKIIFILLFFLIGISFFVAIKNWRHKNKAYLLVLTTITGCDTCKKAEDLLKQINGYNSNFELEICNLQMYGDFETTIKTLDKITNKKIAKIPILIIGNRIYQSEYEIKNALTEIERILNTEKIENNIALEKFIKRQKNKK